MLKFLTAILFVFLVSCSPADLAMKAAGSVLGSGSSSGTSVNANAQIGAENEQSATLGTRQDNGDVKLGTTNNNGSFEISQGKTNKVNSESVGTVVVNETNWQLIVILTLFALVGWMLPTPTVMWSSFTSLFKKKKRTRRRSSNG
jgi:hypothetical protein